MNPLRIVCFAALLLAAVNAKQPNSSSQNKLSPSEWLSASQLQQTPAIDEITVQQLENMSMEKGSQLLEQICK